MLWVALFLVLAVAAVAVLIGYAVWLAHKAADVSSELGQLADRAVELADLLSQVGSPAAPEDREDRSSPSGSRVTRW